MSLSLRVRMIGAVLGSGMMLPLMGASKPAVVAYMTIDRIEAGPVDGVGAAGKVKGGGAVRNVGLVTVPGTPIALLKVVHDAGPVTGSSARAGAHHPITVTLEHSDADGSDIEKGKKGNTVLPQVTILFEPAGEGAGTVAGMSGSANKKGKVQAVSATSPCPTPGTPTKAAQKIVLTNAVIVSETKSGKLEEITFDYQAIQVTLGTGETTAADDWTTQNQ